MFSNRLAFAALAVACIGAAAGGGYLASRQAATSAAASSVTAIPLAESPLTPVQETEAVVDDVALKAPAPSSQPAPAKRNESVRAAAPAPISAPRSTSPAPQSSEPLPTLDRTWPSSAANNASPAQPGGFSTAGTPAPSLSAEATSQAGRNDDRPVLDTPRPPEPPQKAFEELIVPPESVIGLQAETPVTSDRARVEDRIEARVTRDVRVHDIVAIPAGTRALGSVTQVERGGRFKERARLGIRFHTLVLADGTRLPIQTETIYRYGEAPGNESAAKIGGGATIGAIIGAIVGGGKGAAIGASAGAGAGTASVMSGERNSATVHPGEPITVRITSPVTVTVEQN